MRDLLAVWQNTRLVVLVALTAALYAALMMPFKVAQLIPGITEIRPGIVIPFVFGLLFGPAAAWGAAFGNLIGDMLGGMLTPGSPFGFVANLLYAYIPYRVWGVYRMASSEADLDFKRMVWLANYPLLIAAAALCVGGAVIHAKGFFAVGYVLYLLAAVSLAVLLAEARDMGELVLVSALAAAVCAAVVGFGVDVAGMFPFKAVAPVVLVNNLALATVLAPPLLSALYPRMKRWGLLHWQVLGRESPSRSPRITLGVLVCWVGAVAVLLTGIGISGEEAAGLSVLTALWAPLAVLAAGILLI
jgi:energy-coupling factor transport system substrate-specific component